MHDPIVTWRRSAPLRIPARPRPGVNLVGFLEVESGSASSLGALRALSARPTSLSRPSRIAERTRVRSIRSRS